MSVDNRPSFDWFPRLVLAGELAFLSSFGAKLQTRVNNLQPVDKATASECSFDPDCKDPAKPFCNTIYSSSGNSGVCGPTKDQVQQVLDSQSCPPGTLRQPIFPGEGSESVCLTPQPPNQ